MHWFEASDYWLSRLVFERSLAAIYVIAFVVALNQFPALLGEHGLLPAPRFLARVSFGRAPTLFHLRYSDRLLRAVAVFGAVLAASIVAGVPQAGPAWSPLLAWLVLWALYQSIVNVGQIFYAFGWESLLLEAGFLAAFLGPSGTAPPVLVLWLLRWLLFRLEFGAGLIKLRGDRCWRDLTCLYYHHETQPMPNPLSWFFHRLPKPIHRAEVVGNHIAQLVVPFGLFAPQPVAGVCALIVLVHQAWLVASGNFSWLNVLTMALAVSALSAGQIHRVLPIDHGPLGATPLWFVVVVVAVTAFVAVLSYWPIRNMLSPGQLMNFSFNQLHLVNTYGAFGSITKHRYEVIVEGTTDPAPSEATWREYEFKGKPADPARRPRQIAPYHLRLDWLMWFAAMSSPLHHPWLMSLAQKLLEGDPPTLKLLGRNPFPEGPPTFVRVLLYEYRFTTWAERRTTGRWWHRELVGEFVPPLALRPRTPVSPRPG